MRNRLVLVAFAAACIFAGGNVASGAQAPASMTHHSYYLNSIRGSDSNPGTEGSPWKTLENLEHRSFLPGDRIFFARGSSFTGGFAISSSGTSEDPIVITAYGTGPAPLFTNLSWSVLHGNAIQLNGSYIVVESLRFSGGATGPPSLSSSHLAGAIYITLGAAHDTVRDCEITRWPFPIHVYGQDNLITHNYIHDLMSLPSRGWWAVGIVIANSNNRASYNRIVNCRQKSGAFGFDGGAFELDDRRYPKDNITIDHNVSLNNQGFLEIVEGSASVKSLLIAYNVSDDYQQFLRLSSTEIWNARVVNNTVIFTRQSVLIPSVFDLSWFTSYGNMASGHMIPVFVGSGSGCGARDPGKVLRYENNIFYLGGNYMVSPYCDFPHDHNVYYRPEDRVDRAWAILGADAEPGTGDEIANPEFVNVGQEDFHLRPGSPAIHAGVKLGFSRDADGRPVPANSPDAGAFQH